MGVAPSQLERKKNKARKKFMTPAERQRANLQEAFEVFDTGTACARLESGVTQLLLLHCAASSHHGVSLAWLLWLSLRAWVMCACVMSCG